MRWGWRIWVVCAAAMLLAGAPVWAEHTRFWRSTDYSEFVEGTAEGVALWSDGRMVPAPRFAPYADPNLAYLWALRADTRGRLYASGGSSARVVRFDAGGKPETVFQSSDLAAQAIALDSQDNLYVGTSPDGKVYKVTPGGQSAVLFDPHAKYIWSLAIDSNGIVYVGTGDKGEVFAVAPDGKSALFYKSDELHIRALALDGHGNLLLGTDPNGLVIRVAIRRAGPGEPPQAGASFVVYETAGQEVTSFALDPRGNIYVAAIGTKRTLPVGAAGAPQAATYVFAGPTPAGPAGVPAAAGLAAAAAQSGIPAVAPFVPFPATPGGSHVYRIAADGSPTVLWESPSELVYSVGFSSAGKLLIGTGNSGDVIELEGDEIFSKLADTASGQVTGFASGPGGLVYLCTANPGKVFTLGPGIAAEGTFTSHAFDAKIFSQWGRLNWWGDGASGGRVSLYVRSGNTSNPEKNWSRWFGPYTDPDGQPAGCPPARFAQWKVVFHPGAGQPPSLSWVSLAYLPKNVAPVIDGVVVQDPGVRVRTIQIPQTGEQEAGRPVRLRMPREGETPVTPVVAGVVAVQATRFQPPPQGFEEKGWQSVLWVAHDENGDRLEYSVYYRGEKETAWKLLKDHLAEPFYSWDTSAMPDGAYYLRIVATDAPSNPPDEALEAERESARFVVDNTAPAIAGLRAEMASDDAVIDFSAHDPSSPLARAEYSVDAGPWMLLYPAGKLSDAPEESYQIRLKNLAAGEHTIGVRVFDQYENSAIAKTTFTVTAAK
ncbi:MAG TPA: hypothetical protein VGS20_07030 [Candidatus Acidoferrales bacterium]|nr:hypothetical protein [Candidatus Acidoferrales bacterium]